MEEVQGWVKFRRRLPPEVGQYCTPVNSKDLGEVVGYKAGLTNPAVQKRFNYDKPVRGTLFAKMILPGPARVPVASGTRLVYEADMVAVVGDAARVMAAKSQLEALQALKEVRPFIELADMAFDPQVKGGSHQHQGW
jgi:2-keto-4-pentenoate hydratase